MSNSVTQIDAEAVQTFSTIWMRLGAGPTNVEFPSADPDDPTYWEAFIRTLP